MRSKAHVLFVRPSLDIRNADSTIIVVLLELPVAFVLDEKRQSAEERAC